MQTNAGAGESVDASIYIAADGIININNIAQPIMRKYVM